MSKILNPIHSHYSLKDPNKLCVKSALVEFAHALSTYHDASTNLDRYISHNAIAQREAVKKYLESIIQYLCVAANRRSENETQLTIVPDMLSNDYNSRNLEELLREIDTDVHDTPEKYCLQVYSLLNVNDLNSELDTLIDGIQKKGYTEAANNIADFLNLNDRWKNKDPVQLIKSKGRIGMPVRLYDSNYDRQRRLTNQITYTRTMSKESGEHSYVETLEHALERENELSGYSSRIPSRTKIQPNDDVEIVFFLEKMNILFKPQTFETIYSFLSEHCTENLASIEAY